MIEKKFIRGWIALLEAVVKFAERDLVYGKTSEIRIDTAKFLNSEWHDEIVSIVNSWKSRKNY